MNKYPNMFFSHNHKKDIQKVGAILVPGGDLSRVDYLARLLPVDVPIILTGNHYILNAPDGKSESAVAKSHLINAATKMALETDIDYIPVSKDQIIIEDQSVDHFSALYYAKDKIQNILSQSGLHKILGVVTDSANMYTIANCANIHLDDFLGINLMGFVSRESSKLEHVYSRVLTAAWNADVKDTPDLVRYMYDKHPHFAKNPTFSRYGTLVDAAKLAKNLKGLFKK